MQSLAGSECCICVGRLGHVAVTTMGRSFDYGEQPGSLPTYWEKTTANRSGRQWKHPKSLGCQWCYLLSACVIAFFFFTAVRIVFANAFFFSSFAADAFLSVQTEYIWNSCVPLHLCCAEMYMLTRKEWLMHLYDIQAGNCTRTMSKEESFISSCR